MLSPSASAGESDPEGDIRSLSSIGLVSTCLLVVGAILLTLNWTIFLNSDYDVWVDREFRIMNALGFLFFCIHACIELCLIDIRYRPRPLLHSRYGSVTLLNVLQFFLFVMASILQAIAIDLPSAQVDDDDNQEVIMEYSRAINMVASYVWMACALLTLMARPPCCSFNSCVLILDDMANLTFVLSALILILAAYDINENPNEFLGFFLRVFVAFLWLGMSILYLIADIIRFHSAMKPAAVRMFNSAVARYKAPKHSASIY